MTAEELFTQLEEQLLENQSDEEIEEIEGAELIIADFNASTILLIEAAKEGNTEEIDFDEREEVVDIESEEETEEDSAE